MPLTHKAISIWHITAVRGGWTLAHIVGSLAVMSHPGTDIHLPQLHSTPPNGDKPDISLPAMIFLGIVVGVLFSLYYTLAFGDPGRIGAVGRTLSAKRSAPIKMAVDPFSVYVSGVCRWCGTIKLLRTKHCHACNHCVRRFDHHCSWTANCVGAENHRIFFSYLCMQMFFLLFMFEQLIVGIAKFPEVKWIWIPLILLFPLFPAILFVGVLVKMHAEFLAENATTYETFRGYQIPVVKEKQDYNPFELSEAWDNIKHFWTKAKWHAYKVPTNWRSPFWT